MYKNCAKKVHSFVQAIHITNTMLMAENCAHRMISNAGSGPMFALFADDAHSIV